MSGPGEVFWMMRDDGRSLLHHYDFLLLGYRQSKALLVEGIRIPPE